MLLWRWTTIGCVVAVRWCSISSLQLVCASSRWGNPFRRAFTSRITWQAKPTRDNSCIMVHGQYLVHAFMTYHDKLTKNAWVCFYRTYKKHMGMFLSYDRFAYDSYTRFINMRGHSSAMCLRLKTNLQHLVSPINVHTFATLRVPIVYRFSYQMCMCNCLVAVSTSLRTSCVCIVYRIRIA